MPCLVVPFPGNSPAGVGAKLGVGTVTSGPDPAHSSLAWELRMVFTFLKGFEKEYDTSCDPQSLQYLPSGPLQKKLANPWYKVAIS